MSDVWQKLAKKGYLGTKAKVTAEAGGTVNAWGKKHKCDASCENPCKKKED